MIVGLFLLSLALVVQQVQALRYEPCASIDSYWECFDNELCIWHPIDGRCIHLCRGRTEEQCLEPGTDVCMWIPFQEKGGGICTHVPEAMKTNENKDLSDEQIFIWSPLAPSNAGKPVKPDKVEKVEDDQPAPDAKPEPKPKPEPEKPSPDVKPEPKPKPEDKQPSPDAKPELKPKPDPEQPSPDINPNPEPEKPVKPEKVEKPVKSEETKEESNVPSKPEKPEKAGKPVKSEEIEVEKKRVPSGEGIETSDKAVESSTLSGNTEVVEVLPLETPTGIDEAAAEVVETEAASSKPTNPPSQLPTAAPSSKPTNPPSQLPTAEPTRIPTDSPSHLPTAVPTSKPTDSPSSLPTVMPTSEPTSVPSKLPTSSPSLTSPVKDFGGEVFEASLKSSKVKEEFQGEVIEAPLKDTPVQEMEAELVETPPKVARAKDNIETEAIETLPKDRTASNYRDEVERVRGQGKKKGGKKEAIKVDELASQEDLLQFHGLPDGTLICPAKHPDEPTTALKIASMWNGFMTVTINWGDGTPEERHRSSVHAFSSTDFAHAYISNQ